MGFYFRKSKSFGPIRLNFSKSGIGVSTGVKGARLIFSPNGTYVHLGRQGIYYKKKISNYSTHQSQINKSVHFQEELTFDENIIETTNFDNLTDNDSQQFIDEFNTKNNKISFAPILSVVSGLLFIFIFVYLIKSHQIPSQEINYTNYYNIGKINWVDVLILSVFGIVSILSIIRVRKYDFKRKCVEIYYELDETSNKLYNQFIKGFESFTMVQKKWQIPNTEGTSRSKYHGGAQRLINRVDIKNICTHKLPTRFLITNAIVPYISLVNIDLYFFPERIILKKGKKIAAVMYSSINIDFYNSRFIENQNVPSDAQVVDYTWQFVNKSGGPDRRFNNNRKLPICEYSYYSFQTEEGFNEVISTSKLCGMDDFVKSILQIKTLQQSFLINQTTSLKLKNSDNSISVRISEKANHIIQTKPENWEFLLTYELLKIILNDLVSSYKNLNSIKETKLASDKFIMNLILDVSILDLTDIFTNELTKNWLIAMGEPGKQGDAQLIKKSIFRLHEISMQVMNWETELRSIYSNTIEVQESKRANNGWTLVYITAVKDVYFKLKKYIESNFEGNLDIQTTMDSPDSLKEFLKKKKI